MHVIRDAGVSIVSAIPSPYIGDFPGKPNCILFSIGDHLQSITPPISFIAEDLSCHSPDPLVVQENEDHKQIQESCDSGTPLSRTASRVSVPLKFSI